MALASPLHGALVRRSVALAVALTALTLLQGLRTDDIQAAARRMSGELACDTPTPIVTDSRGWREAHAATESEEVWGLLFNPHRHGERVKIAWRITGSGPVTVTAHNRTSNGALTPVSGPTEHTSSNWNRPGDEWGTIFVFPHAGCWRIDVTRGDTTARFWFTVG